MSNYFTINITNNRNVTENGQALNVLFTGTDVSVPTTPASTVTLGQSIAFPSSGPLSLYINTVTSGRLYLGYGTLPCGSGLQPVPSSNQYFGWIEFTKTAANNHVWINLSNVDMSGLPLSLSGTSFGQNFTLGYKNPATSLVTAIENILVPSGSSNPAVITCSNGSTKIVAPDIMPGSYTDYWGTNGYVTSLTKAEAKLIIRSDTPSGASAQTFTGSFLDPSKTYKGIPQGAVISLTCKENKDTFVVLQSEFTNKIIYGGDGGTIIFNGKTVNQNRGHIDPTQPGYNAEHVITNSVFRNLIIGINEGYFQPGIVNYSTNFSYYAPFQNGHGNMYAKAVHENTNSYGFAYADSNLKVLVKADPTTLNLTILKDNQAGGYDATPPSTGNSPAAGDYYFVTGTKCSLGTIMVGNCSYPVQNQGTYSGFLPTFDDWFKMIFNNNPQQYIWIKTSGGGQVVAGNCLLEKGKAYSPSFTSISGQAYKYTMAMGPNITWNPGAKPPAKPKH